MCFQAAECNAANASLSLNLNNNFLIFFLTESLPILNPYTYPQNPKICDPILETLLKMRPHYSHSSRENATPSSGTSPLASCKRLSPPPPGLHHLLWFRSAGYSWNFFSRGYCNFKPNQDGNSNSKGNRKSRGSVWCVQTKRTLVSTLCDEWCNEC